MPETVSENHPNYILKRKEKKEKGEKTNTFLERFTRPTNSNMII